VHASLDQLAAAAQPAAPPQEQLRVAVVGGLSRATGRWSRAGDDIGVHVEHHDGQTAGRGSREIVAAIKRSDVVVIITDRNSHGGVAVARRAAISASRPHVLIKHLRPEDLRTVLGSSFARRGQG
jgi:Uncharacterized protein conserved in bacteria (DUF2325)